MRKSRRNEQLMAVFIIQATGIVFSKIRGAFPNIHSDIQDFALKHRHQFRLRMLQLVMQSSQRSAGGSGQIILDETHVDSGGGIPSLMKGLGEESPSIPVEIRAANLDSGQGGIFERSAHDLIRGVFRKLNQVLPIVVLFHGFPLTQKLRPADVSLSEGDFLNTGDHKSLSLLNGLDKI